MTIPISTRRAFELPAIACTRKALELMAFGCLASNAMAQEPTVYHDFTLVDPATRTLTEDAYLVVEGSMITDVGEGMPTASEGLRLVDMSGRWALPGLIDAHAHITAGRMSVKVVDDAPVITMHTIDEVTRFNALVALASGVTTIRNPAGAPTKSAHYDEMVAEGEWLGPEALHAGLIFDPTPIVGGSVYPSDEAGWEQEIVRQKSLGIDYIKLYTGLTELELATGIRLAHEHGLETIAHLDRVSWSRAVDLGIDALTHALPTSPDLLEEPERAEYASTRSIPSSTFMYQWFELVDYGSPPIRELIQKLVESGVHVDLTLAVNELVYMFDELDSLYSLDEGNFMHPDMIEPWLQQMSASHFGWTEEDYARAHAVMPKVLEFGKLLHDAGVSLLLGTDGPGGGPSFLRELSLHARAGIEPWDILALATTLNAEGLGIGNRTGSLKAGLEADVVFLNANPVDDVANVAEIDLVVSNGSAYRATELEERRSELIGQSR